MFGVALLGMRLRRRLQGFPVGLHQRVNLLPFNTGHEVLVGLYLRDRRAEIAPLERIVQSQKVRHLLRGLRQDRGEIVRQNPESVEQIRTQSVQFSAFFRDFCHIPGLVLVYLLIDEVHDTHDFADGFSELPVRIGLLDEVFRPVHGHRVAPAPHQGFGVFGRQCAAEMLVQDGCVAADDIDVLPDEVAVYPRDEVLQAEVYVLHRRPQLGGVVVAQPFRVEALVEVALRGDKGAARLGHLLAVDGQEAVSVDAARRPVARLLEHGRPEQGMEVEYVLADEMDHFGLFGGSLPRVGERVEIHRLAGRRSLVAIVAEAAEVTNGRVEPDVEVLAGRARYLETEVRGIARDVPVVEPGLEPFVQLVGGLGLQRARARPFPEKRFARAELEEVMLR